ncbi:hypothetical protein NIES37_54500 [Tolypothrix tenuis PCC 7101]|uniref:Fe2OG dioxygenase domain-containing protein n=1 Tax=Tolypothrix tenuis PCC 7101 TaxID=231146 RepID=A0A1Z4N6U5_9CYAN|nr:hypothetical protein [Aulosira sp. FACHB-113]BAZ01450.1 hypothetical protein NIES37_54500 [Tolypothrix tenuis PCC 7101]BAZ74627.1 hypothetical protein NIES50_32050 [Aulosira laxa NIES-50]
MSLMTTNGYICSDLQSLHDWCNNQSLTQQMLSSNYVSSRTHKWFGYEVILKPNPIIKKGHWDEKVNRLGNLILPGWDCALLCHYYPGGYMTQHRDHSVFEPQLVLVNIGCATLCIDNQEHHLEDGQVISFNSAIPHELLPVKSHRWSLTFRKIKPQYLRF